MLKVLLNPSFFCSTPLLSLVSDSDVVDFQLRDFDQKPNRVFSLPSFFSGKKQQNVRKESNEETPKGGKLEQKIEFFKTEKIR